MVKTLDKSLEIKRRRTEDMTEEIKDNLLEMIQKIDAGSIDACYEFRTLFNSIYYLSLSDYVVLDWYEMDMFKDYLCCANIKIARHEKKEQEEMKKAQ